MPGLLKMKKDYRWDTQGIEFVLKERVGIPEKFLSQKKELEFLYEWYQLIKNKDSASIAFLGCSFQKNQPLFIWGMNLAKVFFFK